MSIMAKAKYLKSGFRFLMIITIINTTIFSANIEEGTIASFQKVLKYYPILPQLTVPFPPQEKTLSLKSSHSLWNGHFLDATKRLIKIKKDSPFIKCLMLSMYDHVGYISKALELGADGYVTKNAATKELMDALESLEKDENYLSTDISKKLAFGDKQLTSILTEREKEIFLLLAKGFQPKQIAYYIDTAPKTVMVHRTNIYKKLNVTSQFGLLRIALETGYLDVSDVIYDDTLVKAN